MPIVSRTRGFQGRARVNLTPLTGGRKFQLGNTSGLTENIEVERTSRPNFQETGGGELDVLESISSMTVNMTVDDIKPETIAIGLRADLKRLIAEPVAAEAHAAWSGERVTFKYLPDPDVDVTVSLSGGTWAAETDFAVGATVIKTGQAYRAIVAGTSDEIEPDWPTDGGTETDGTVTWKHIGPVALPTTAWARTKHGIQFTPAGDALFPQPDAPLAIVVGYTRSPQYAIQALMNSGEEFTVEVEGENAADRGVPNIVRYFRGKFSPTSGFPRIGAEFASMELVFTLLEDSTRVGAGDSKYMEILTP